MPETDVSRALERVLNCKGYSMKKLMLLSACLLAVPALHAEQMQFVTTLSAPVGNFAQLDAADPTHVTSAPLLNFCNTRSGVGKIIIKGANAYLAQANILNGATLGSTNTPEYRLSDKLTVENGGTVTAGRVMASNVTFKDTNFHKSNVTGTLYGSDIAAMGGKADNMEPPKLPRARKPPPTWGRQWSGATNILMITILPAMLNCLVKSILPFCSKVKERIVALLQKMDKKVTASNARGKIIFMRSIGGIIQVAGMFSFLSAQIPPTKANTLALRVALGKPKI